MDLWRNEWSKWARIFGEEFLRGAVYGIGTAVAAIIWHRFRPYILPIFGLPSSSS